MNPTFTNTNSIHQNVLNMVPSQEITVFQEVPQSGRTQTVGRPSAWNDNIIKVLLRLIIDTGFYAKHAILDNSGKTRLWQKLHDDFCNHLDVVRYAASPLNAGFSSKYEAVKYIKDKFQSIKKDFQKITAEIRRTGSGGPPPQERYIHFDDMKEITLSNPGFFLSMLMETGRVVDEVVAEAVISICQDDGVTYKNTQLTTPSFVSEGRSEMSQWSYSTPNPVPSPRQGTEPVSTSGTRRTTPSELQQAFLENSRSQTDIMTSMHDLLSTRLDVIASQEARRLDWESRELIATREYNRQVIADEREEESRRSLLEILSRRKRSRGPSSYLTRINELN
ncbi:hypothetical protein F4703DRAFT_1792660 [Phycomyces blakesleeanus]